MARRRVALVIGNGRYAIGSLENPKRDALKVHSTLQRRGFSVELAIDADRDEIQRCLEQLETEAVGAEMAVVYFAGHGVEVKGAGYILPTDITFPITAGSLQYYGIPSSDLLKSLQGCSGPRILVVDSCRIGIVNLAADEIVRANQALDVIRNEEARLDDVLIAYSTSSGEIARDGLGENSIYCERLCENIINHSLSIEDVFKTVGFDVMRATGNQQRPWYYSSLNNRYRFSDFDEFKAIHTQRIPAGLHGDMPSLSGHHDLFEILVSSGNKSLSLLTISAHYTLDKLMSSSIIGTAMAGQDKHVAIDSEANLFVWSKGSLQTIAIEGVTPHGVRISPDGSKILIYGRQRVILATYQGNELSITYAGEMNFEPYCATFLSDDEAWVAGQDGKIARVRLKLGKCEIEELNDALPPRSYGHAYSMSYAFNRREIVITYSDGKLVIYSLATAKISRTFELPEYVQSTITRRESLMDSVAGEMITNFIFHPETLSDRDRKFCESKLPPNQLMFSSVSQEIPVVAVGSSDGFLYIVDLRDGQIAQQIDVCSDRGSGVEGVQFIKEGLLAIITRDCFIYHFSSGSVPMASELPLENGRLIYRGSDQVSTI